MSLNESDRARATVVVGEPVEARQTTGWQIVDGLPEKYWDQLIEYSTTDPEVIKNTSDPARFPDRESIIRWREKGRDTYTITDPTGEQLLGLYWFGPEEIKLINPKKPEENYTVLPGQEFTIADYPITNARRLYGPLRGKGQSNALFWETFRRFIQTDTFKNSTGGIWTETSGPTETTGGNEGVLKVDIRNGFRRVTETNGRGKVILVADRNVLLENMRAHFSFPAPAPRRPSQ